MTTSRERIRATLAHREPDRIPFDLGGTRVTGIHLRAYERLRPALGLEPREGRVIDITQQLADVEPDVLEAMDADVRLVPPRAGAGYKRIIAELDGHHVFTDEWGVGRRMPIAGGMYYDSYAPPLTGEIGLADVEAYPWPDATDGARYAGMAEDARAIAAEGRAIAIGSICGGLTEGLFKLRGFEEGYMDLAAEPALAVRIMERILEVKIAYWDRVLPLVDGNADILVEADDLGGQDRTLFSPRTYRELVKPLHRALFEHLHARTDAKVFFHTCGAVRELIPDLVEIGVDILNPVQVSASGMETAALKRDFGRDVVFWGGGVDTQRVLGAGTPDEVRAEVRRRVTDLRDGGGFVFAAVHNIQPNVPAENILAMREALREVQGA
ncbi:MAG: uroporphyrinogen decarboxylase family protein [Chloroflexota bacterium]